MSNPIYVSKQLNALSSAGIGSISSGQSSAASLNSSQLDTQRRISIWASSNGVTSASFLVTGTQEGGGSIYEWVTGPSSTTPSATVQDFLTVSSIAASSALQSQVVIGTNNQGSTPWQSVNVYITPINLGAYMHFTSTANGMIGSIEMTMDNPFSASQTAPVPGGYAPLHRLSEGSTMPPFLPWISSAFSSMTSDNWDPINVAGPLAGNLMPIYAWRLLLTSSSSTAGNVDVHAIQAGVGV